MKAETGSEEGNEGGPESRKQALGRKGLCRFSLEEKRFRVTVLFKQLGDSHIEELSGDVRP